MSPQDEKLVDELFGEEGPLSNYIDDREPQVTADGYDYGTLLMLFQPVVDQPGTKQPRPGFYMAPGANCTFSVH